MTTSTTFTAAPKPKLGKHFAEIWTRLAVDPLAEPLARWLARQPGVTPNRLTVAAGVIAVASIGCFLTGNLRVGGALFVLRFFVDCLDGKVARAQGSSSARGAALDQIVDVIGVSGGYAALSWFLVTEGVLVPAIPVALLASVALYTWLLAYRKHMADRAGIGDGGAGGQVRTSVPILRHWVDWCRRMDMTPIPYAVEAEIVSLGLIPLLATASISAAVLWGTLCFYLIASAVNIRRVWRAAAMIDAAGAQA